MMPGWGTVMVGEQFWRTGGERGGGVSVSVTALLSLSRTVSGDNSNCVSQYWTGLVFGHNWTLVLSQCLIYCTSALQLLRKATLTLAECLPLGITESWQTSICGRRKGGIESWKSIRVWQRASIDGRMGEVSTPCTLPTSKRTLQTTMGGRQGGTAVM